MAIQEVLEKFEWVSHAGSPVAYAPHLRRAPLAGVPVKSVIYQFAKGDLGAANPNTTAILRAATSPTGPYTTGTIWPVPRCRPCP